MREGFDVSVRGGGPLADSTLMAKKIARLDRAVVAAERYLERAGEPRAPAELAKHRCLVYSLARSPTRWSFVKNAIQRSVQIDGPLHVNSSLALVRAAEAGAGIALVPVLTVQRELDERRLVRILRDWQSEPQALYAVSARHRQSSRLARLFVEHLMKIVRKKAGAP